MPLRRAVQTARTQNQSQYSANPRTWFVSAGRTTRSFFKNSSPRRPVFPSPRLLVSSSVSLPGSIRATCILIRNRAEADPLAERLAYSDRRSCHNITLY